MQQLYTLGRLYEEAGDQPHAVEMYKAVIRLGSDQSEILKKATTNLNALDSKKNLWQTNLKIVFTPLSPEINTPNQESLGRWTLD